MLNWIIDWSLRNRFIVIVASLLFAGLGVMALKDLDIDAFPDTTPVQVQINTVAPSLGPEEVERQISFPVEQALGGLPHLQNVRSVSKFGFSQVVVTFDDGMSIFLARQLVAERLNSVEIPEGISRPQMGPIATGLGEVFHYVVSSDTIDLTELRTIHDWTVKPALRTVPGVAEVNSWGGFEKQFQVRIDPDRLVKYDVAFDEVTQAIRRNNANVGGGNIARSGGSLLVQGLGRVGSLDEIRNIPITARGGVPIRVADVAEVNIGAEIRRGAVTYDGKGEAILGLGFMLMGENSHDVTSRLRDKLTEIRPFLPAGVSVDIVYDRTELVDQVIDTVRKNLFEGGLLVIAVLFVFLGNLRAGLIVASAIPLSMLFAFDSMLRFGISGSLLSLGAIDFGLVVDSSVIMIENTMRHLAHDQSSRRKIDIVRDAAIEVRKPTMFGELIIIIVFLPILTLEGVEGKMFKPMALTFIFALVGSLVLSLTLMPVLASLLLPRKVQEREPLVVRLAHMVYAPLLRLAQRSRLVVIGLALALLAVTVMGIRGLGAEFVPKLGEGSIVANTIRLAGTDIDESIRMNTVMEKEILRQFSDEVEHVWSRIGTAEVATDPMGVELTDIFMTLRPRSQWKRAATREELVREMDHALRDLPGQRVAFTQPIEMRMNEMSAGIKADVGIKLYGDDLSVLTNKSGEIAAVLEGIKGATDVSVEQLTGQPVLQVRVLPDAIARYGIPASEVLELVESLGTMELGTVVEGELRFPLVSRLPDRLRSSPEAIGSVLITAPNGERVLLSKLASIQETEGPSTITREWGQRRSTIQANVRGRDIGSFVAEAQAAIAADVELPPGRYRLEWGGQFENLQRAQTRLAIVVPVALLLIFLLLYLSFKSTRLALLVYTGVPFAVVGGVTFLWARGLPFSISAGVGFIALSGVAVLNGLVMVTFIRQLRRRGLALQQAIFEGCMVRLRPVLMTATVAALGFVPMALATGVGAEVQRPLATVVIGGVISSTILTLFVLPILYPWFEPKGDAEEVDHEEQGAGPGNDPARAGPGAHAESTNGLVAAPSTKPATA
ncbi:MAG: efflux RND transporter permease subunit [Phycisphaeraceae bacterium]|nr:efflux RND transporter permease subunit [Phycisphaeraceae bacterium]